MSAHAAPYAMAARTTCLPLPLRCSVRYGVPCLHIIPLPLIARADVFRLFGVRYGMVDAGVGGYNIIIFHVLRRRCHSAVLISLFVHFSTTRSTIHRARVVFLAGTATLLSFALFAYAPLCTRTHLMPHFCALVAVSTVDAAHTAAHARVARARIFALRRAARARAPCFALFARAPFASRVRLRAFLPPRHARARARFAHLRTCTATISVCIVMYVPYHHQRINRAGRDIDFSQSHTCTRTRWPDGAVT